MFFLRINRESINLFGEINYFCAYLNWGSKMKGPLVYFGDKIEFFGDHFGNKSYFYGSLFSDQVNGSLF